MQSEAIKMGPPGGAGHSTRLDSGQTRLIFQGAKQLRSACQDSLDCVFTGKFVARGIIEQMAVGKIQFKRATGGKTRGM